MIRTRVPSGVFRSLVAWVSWVGGGLFVCVLSVYLVSVRGGSRPADPPLCLGKEGRQAKRPTLATHPATHPSDPPSFLSPSGGC